MNDVNPSLHQALPQMQKENDVFVPKKKTNSIFFIALVIFAGIAFFIGLTSFSSIFGYVYAYIFAFVMALTSWDPIIISLVIAGISWFVAAMLYVLGTRGNELADKLDSATQFIFNSSPTDYVEMDLVPTEILVNEMIERGCEANVVESKLVINCEKVPLTKEMKAVLSGEIHSITIKRKAIITIMTIIGAVVIGLIIYSGLITGIFAGIIIMVYVFGASLILIQFKVIKLWHSIIVWILMNMLFVLLGVDWLIVWISIGLLVGYAILLATLYFVFENSCYQKEKWWCEFMKGAERIENHDELDTIDKDILNEWFN